MANEDSGKSDALIDTEKGLALLDLNTPEHCLKRDDEWFFGPEEPYEQNSNVGYVVFPCFNGPSSQEDFPMNRRPTGSLSLANALRGTGPFCINAFRLPPSLWPCV